MQHQSAFLAELLAYLLGARVVLRCLQGGWRDWLFTLLNLTALYWFCFHEPDDRYLATYLAYLGLAVVGYVTLWRFARSPGRLPWIAFFTPIIFLILIRFVPATVYGGPLLPYGPFFIGISYLAFRTSHLVIEIRNGVVAMPGLARYLGYCFFVPTLSVGPISPYSRYECGFAGTAPVWSDARAALRLLVGLVKYKFLGGVFLQLGYANLLLDDHYHPWIDLPVAMVAYYLFLYCNFSGFCDIAIGAAGLIGIPVAENFENPLAARNMREFWNRWHITLSQYMRDVVFVPLSKALVGRLGPARLNHALALTIVVVFLLIGIWHGVGWNFVAYGLAQALGVVTVHYYTIFLKQKLGRDGFKAYNEKLWVQAAAVVITFAYFSASLIFFACTFEDIRHIFSVLR